MAGLMTMTQAHITVMCSSITLQTAESVELPRPVNFSYLSESKDSSYKGGRR